MKIILLTMILFLCSCAYYQPYPYAYYNQPVYYAPPVIYQRQVVIYPQYYPYYHY